MLLRLTMEGHDNAPLQNAQSVPRKAILTPMEGLDLPRWLSRKSLHRRHLTIAAHEYILQGKTYIVPIVSTVNTATPNPIFSYASDASFQLIWGVGSSFGCPSDWVVVGWGSTSCIGSMARLDEEWRLGREMRWAFRPD
jgi:hypothetical protein